MIAPIKNKIVFKPFMMDEKSLGGIIVPGSYRGESDKGEIVAVGNGADKKPMQFSKGQIAHRVHLWGELYEEDGQKFYIMEQDAILATE